MTRGPKRKPRPMKGSSLALATGKKTFSSVFKPNGPRSRHDKQLFCSFCPLLGVIKRPAGPPAAALGRLQTAHSQICLAINYQLLIRPKSRRCAPVCLPRGSGWCRWEDKLGFPPFRGERFIRANESPRTGVLAALFGLKDGERPPHVPLALL